MLYQRGAIWWTRFELNGTRRFVSTHCRDRREAEKEARRIRVETEQREGQQGKPGRPCGVTLEKLEALDLARVQDEGLGDEKSVRYRTVEGLWRPLLRIMGPGSDASKVSIGDVAAYTGARRREIVKGQTVKREVEALVRALRIAKRDKLITALPFDPDDLPRIRFDPPSEQQRGKLWRVEQIAAVLANLSSKAVKAGHLDRCRLIMLTGLRLEELHRLQPSWVVPVLPGSGIDAMLHVPADAAKWGKARTIPLVPEALEIVERCAPFARKKPNKSLALASKNAGLPGVLTPRDLRTLFLSATGAHDPVAAQWLGGHTNIATTGLYLKSTEQRAALAVVAAADTLRVATAPVATAKTRDQQNAK
jgi:integrase